MWIFLPFGFYSVVSKPPSAAMNMDYATDGFLCVRVRRMEDLETLKKRLQEFAPDMDISPMVGDNFGTDYQGRMWVEKKAFGDYLSWETNQLSYSNFKNQIQDNSYHSVCSKVWSVMHGLVSRKKKSSKRRSRKNQLNLDDLVSKNRSGYRRGSWDWSQ